MIPNSYSYPDYMQHHPNQTQKLYCEVIDESLDRVSKLFKDKGIGQDRVDLIRKGWEQRLIQSGVLGQISDLRSQTNTQRHSKQTMYIGQSIHHPHVVKTEPRDIHVVPMQQPFVQLVGNVQSNNRRSALPMVNRYAGNNSNRNSPAIPITNPLTTTKPAISEAGLNFFRDSWSEIKKEPMVCSDIRARQWPTAHPVSSLGFVPQTVQSSTGPTVIDSVKKRSDISQMDGKRDHSSSDDQSDDPDDSSDEDNGDESDIEEDETGLSDSDEFSHVSGIDLTATATEQEATAEPVEDVDPLNSDDDLTDEEQSGVHSTSNIIICKYDKISRAKAKWKFAIKDAVMHVDGREYVFSKAYGEAEW
ncbi:hypothetical protein ACOME3_003999 [Neoechinorhynchus agilis]